MAELTREEFDRIQQEATRADGVRHRDTLISINNLATEVRDFASAITRQLESRSDRSGKIAPWGNVIIVLAVVAAINAPMWTVLSSQGGIIETIDARMRLDDERERIDAAKVAKLRAEADSFQLIIQEMHRRMERIELGNTN